MKLVYQHAIPVALLFFNLGVHTSGQLAFIGCVMTAIACIKWIAITQALSNNLTTRVFGFSNAIAAYTIGTIAALWLIERTLAILV